MLSFLIHLLFQNRNLSIFIVVSLIMLCSIHVVEPTVPVQTVDTRDFFICSPDESTTTHTHRPSNIVIPTDVLPNLVGTLGVGLTAAKVATTIKGGIPTKVVAVGLTYFTASLGVGIAQNITNPDVSRLNANSAISRILHSALETVGPNSTTSPWGPNGPASGPNGPEGPVASSPMESEGTIFTWVINSLPDWIVRDILGPRVPPYGSDLGDYTILFTQYNFLVCLMIVTVIIIYVSIFFIVFGKTMQKYQDFLVLRFPKTLGKVATSNWINIIIASNSLAIAISSLIFLHCLQFMFVNYIPGEIGPLIDAAVQSTRS
jgi:hypothetical protein